MNPQSAAADQAIEEFSHLRSTCSIPGIGNASGAWIAPFNVIGHVIENGLNISSRECR
jgi:hypothetical protein